MSKPLQWIVIGLILVVVIFYSGCYFERSRWNARFAQVQIDVQALDSANDKLRIDSAAIAVRVKIDTVRYTKSKIEWRDLVKYVHDSAGRDTLTKQQIIDKGTVTVESCSAAFLSCTERAFNAESRSQNLEKNNADLKLLLSKPKPIITTERAVFTAIIGVLIAKQLKVF